MGILATLLLGIVGSFIGGAIWSLFSDDKILDFNAGGLHPVGRGRDHRAADLQPLRRGYAREASAGMAAGPAGWAL